MSKLGRLRCGWFLLGSLLALPASAGEQASASVDPQLQAPARASSASTSKPLPASAWLDRMSHSFRELSYQGVFSYQQGDRMESFRIAHAVYDGEEYERLEHLDGDPREIVRRGHSLNCLHPGHQLVRLYEQQNRQSVTGNSQPGVTRYYQFSVLGQDRVAGREVVRIAVSPRDDHRFGYTLALDTETGLLLRSTLLGLEGNVLERFQFVEVAIGIDIPRAHFQSSGHSYKAMHQKPPAEQMSSGRASDPSLWQVNWLPGGFTATMATQQFGRTDMATFTDGLTVFSVFLEVQENLQDSAEGSAQHGPTMAYSTALLLDNRPYRVTVVGEIPHNTAKKIAKSVTLAGT